MVVRDVTRLKQLEQMRKDFVAQCITRIENTTYGRDWLFRNA